jgi:prepilin-type N-terminal cleavage/methylation domain-containing protein
MKFFIKKKNIFCSKSKFTTGFTLVELLITIVIFVMLTGVVLFNQNKFDSTILLKNLAYDIALTIRQAQTYGVNVKESPISGDFTSYGVYIKIEENKKIIFFSDLSSSKDRRFSDADTTCSPNDTSSECLQKYTLKRGNYISKLCVLDTDGSCLDVDELTINFVRPNPDAYIYADDDFVNRKKYAEIELSSSDNSSKISVVVTSVGQIYVKKQ